MVRVLSSYGDHGKIKSYIHEIMKRRQKSYVLIFTVTPLIAKGVVTLLDLMFN